MLKKAYYEKNLSHKRPLMKIEGQEKTCVSLLCFELQNSEIGEIRVKEQESYILKKVVEGRISR